MQTTKTRFFLVAQGATVLDAVNALNAQLNEKFSDKDLTVSAMFALPELRAATIQQPQPVYCVTIVAYCLGDLPEEVRETDSHAKKNAEAAAFLHKELKSV
jgi:hypothetical protein